jgi:tetratricopeptide (TPR) repeat protein
MNFKEEISSGQIFFSEESLAIARENGDQYFISINLINLGRVYSEKKEFMKAEYFLEDSLKIIREYGYSLNLHPALINLAKIFKDKGDYTKAIDKYKEFFIGSSKPGGNFFLKVAFLGLIECYYKLEDFQKAVYNLAYTETISETTEIKLSEGEKTFLKIIKN